MFAGVPRTNPSAASTSETVAASAGWTVTSIFSSSGSRAPAMTASSIACSAGDEVWWTTSSRRTLPRCLLLPAEGRPELSCDVREDLHVVGGLEGKGQRERDLGDLTERRVSIQGLGDLARLADQVRCEHQPGRPDRARGARRAGRDVGLVLGPLPGVRAVGGDHN